MGATSLLAGLSEPQRRDPSVERVDLERLFPAVFGSWRTYGAMNGFVRPANQPVYRIYDQVLERTYVSAEGPSVMLSVAYGGTQADGLELHRPELCYRAHGFAVRGARPEEIRTSDATVPVNRLMADVPGRPEVITYWVTLAGEVVPDANAFRLQSLWYAARRMVVDGLLVRVSTIDPISARAYAVHDTFVTALLAAIPRGDRAIVFGRESSFRRA